MEGGERKHTKVCIARVTTVVRSLSGSVGHQRYQVSKQQDAVHPHPCLSLCARHQLSGCQLLSLSCFVAEKGVQAAFGAGRWELCLINQERLMRPLWMRHLICE